jgi:transcription elongation factor
MEQNARLKDPQNHGLSMRREAMDKAARERRRAEKAASRMSVATTPGSATPAYQRTPSMISSVLPTRGSSTPSYQQTPSTQSHAASMVRSVDDADPAQAIEGANEEMRSSSN